MVCWYGDLLLIRSYLMLILMIGRVVVVVVVLNNHYIIFRCGNDRFWRRLVKLNNGGEERAGHWELFVCLDLGVGQEVMSKIFHSHLPQSHHRFHQPQCSECKTSRSVCGLCVIVVYSGPRVCFLGLVYHLLQQVAKVLSLVPEHPSATHRAQCGEGMYAMRSIDAGVVCCCGGG